MKFLGFLPACLLVMARSESALCWNLLSVKSEASQYLVSSSIGANR